MRVGIVGATGAVGQEILKLLESRRFPVTTLLPMASRSRPGGIVEATLERMASCDVLFYASPASVSLATAQQVANGGALVVDNSSAFRMHPSVPLVIPEVNPTRQWGLISNPNCSTILLLTAVHSLLREFEASEIVVSTYQSASGAGASGMRELTEQAKAWCSAGGPDTGLVPDVRPAVFPQQYLWNCFSHNTEINLTTGHNREEVKMMQEVQKIMGMDLPVSCTCVRVPVLRSHCEAVNIRFRGEVPSVRRVREMLASSSGVTLVDDRESNTFPTPLGSQNRDDVLVGRVRHDAMGGVALFLSGDQIRKGAALNAVQIAEMLVSGTGGAGRSSGDAEP